MLFVRGYDANGAFAASRDFVYDGKDYKANDVFPWRELKLATAQVLMLWQAGHVHNVVEQPKAVNVQRKR